MKKHYIPLTLLLFCLWGFAFPTFAQEQTTAASDSLITRANIKDNTIFWQQDLLVQHKEGKIFEVKEPIQYPNGTVVFSDGRVRTSDGKTMTLKPKHAVSPQGRIVLVADDIFTYDTIVEHERQVVGNTETRIVVIDGKIASVSSGNQKQEYSIGQEKKIELLEKQIQLLEQRAKLLETSLSPTELKSIEAYYNGLNKQIANVDNQLNALNPSVK